MSLPFAVRGATGVHLALGPPHFGSFDQFTPVDTTSCRSFKFSPTGQYFAYAFANTLKLIRTDEWKDISTINGTKTYFIAFSPLNTYLMTWEPYEVSKEKEAGTPNLRIYRSCTGEFVKGFIHKPKSNWEPKWSNDEKIFSKISNNDVVFYDGSNFDKVLYRIDGFKVASYSLSTSGNLYHVLVHTPGSVGQPSIARLFQLPNFEATQAIASRTFFQADNVEYHWNANETHCLLLASTEQDKTGKSYYGKHSLHFFTLTGSTNMVTLPKEGPIYSVSWNPKGHEFCVVYGFTPARASIFNTKCDVVFELGSGPRNAVYYNPHGNLLLLGGFGNLQGKVEIYDMKKRKQVGTCDASDTTLLEWSPDGEHFLTATTSPRLRICNGYKIWHYSGVLVHDTDIGELYDVGWMNVERNVFREPVITEDKVEGIASKQVKASTQAYRPPSARNRPAVTFSLHDEEKMKEQQVSKSALKQRKKREAKKARKVEENAGDEKDEAKATTKKTSSVEVVLTGDAEKDKKLKNIKRKLDAIEKLKVMQAEGKSLEINQVDKIKGEADLLKELSQLQL